MIGIISCESFQPLDKLLDGITTALSELIFIRVMDQLFFETEIHFYRVNVIELQAEL